MTRRLVLRGETLAELTPAELSHVAGAAPATPSCPAGPSDVCPTAPLLECLTERYSIAGCG